jgi:TP901 family phage tail tape measure protein
MAAGVAKLQLLIDLKNKLKVGLDGAQRQVRAATGDMQRRVNTFRAGTIQAFDHIKSEVPGVSKMLNLLKNPFVGAAAGALAIGSAMVKSTQMASQWEEQLGQINVTANMSKEELSGVSDRLKEVAGRNANDLWDVPKAFNTILSATGDVGMSLEMLEPALRAAKAGFVDVNTSANAGVSTALASGRDIKEVYDILIATLQEGKAEFADIAHYLPAIVAPARNVGATLEETAGAFALMSKSLPTAKAAHSLQSVMAAFGDTSVAIGEMDKKTGEWTKGFKSIGVDVFDEQPGKLRSMVDIAADLNKAMEGLSDAERAAKFDKIGLDQNAALGFSVMMQDVEGLKTAVDATTNSTGKLDEAFANARHPMDDWKIVMNQIKIAMINIGEIFLPIVGAIGTGVKATLSFVKEYLPSVLTGLAAVGVALAVVNAKLIGLRIATIVSTVATKLHAISWKALGAAIRANPLGFFITLIGVAVTAITILWKKCDGFRAVIKGIWEVMKGFAGVLKNYVIDRIKGIISGIGTLGSAIGKLFKGDFSGAWQDAKKGVADLTGLNAREKAFESTKNLKENFKTAYNAEMDASKKKQEGDFSGVPEEEKKEDEKKKKEEDEKKKKLVVPTPPASDAQAIAAGNGGRKTVNIVIESFIKNFTSEHKSIQSMSKDELEKWMMQMFQRTTRSAELM